MTTPPPYTYDAGFGDLTKAERAQANPQFDNPIHNLIHNVLGNKGGKTNNLGDYLKQGIRAAQGTTLGAEILEPGAKGKLRPNLPHRQFLKRLDPFGVVPNLGGYKRIPQASLEFQDVLDATLGNSPLKGILIGAGSRHGLGNRTFELLQGKEGSLFYGADDIGYKPIPYLQGRTIRVGHKTYSAGSIYEKNADSFGPTHSSVISRIHEEIIGSISETNYSENVFVALGTKGLSDDLKKTLRPGPSVAKMDTYFTDVAGAMSRVHFRDKTSALAKAIEDHNTAGSIINIITRSGRVPRHLNPGDLPISTIFNQARAKFEQFPTELISALDAINPELKEYYPFIKAEYLLGGDKGITLPNIANIKKLFGNVRATEGMLTKGYHQIFKRANLSIQHARRIGRNALPYYITKGRVAEAARLGKPEMLMHGMPMTIGVMDFPDELASRLLMQESGMLLTPEGARLSAQRIPLPRLSFDATSERNVKLVENIFNLNLSTEGKQVIDKFYSFSGSELETAVYTEDREWKQLVKDKAVTNKQKNLRKLLRSKSGKINSQVGNLSLMDRSRLSQVEVRGDKILMDFVTSGGSNVDAANNLPSVSEMELGGRRFSAQLLNSSITDGLGKFGIHGIVPTSEFLKMTPDDVLLNTLIYQTTDNAKYANIRDDITALVRKQIPGINLQQVTVNVNTKIKHIQRLAAQIGDDDLRTVVADARKMLQEWSNGVVAPGHAHIAGSLKQIANDVLFGEKVILPSGAELPNIRKFVISGGMRSDFMSDIDPMKGTRLTASKLSFMAHGARLAGYDDVMDSPVFGLLKKRLDRSNLEFDPNTLLLKLKKNSSVVKAMTAVAGIGLEAPDPASVITIGRNGLVLNGRELGKIPRRKDFRHRSGGVKFKNLKGTLLDRSSAIPDVAFIDLGKVMNIKISGKERPIRYVPFMKNYARTNKGVGGRLVIDNKNTAVDLIHMINRIESGVPLDDSKESLNDLERYVNKFIAGMARPKVGKRGLLEQVETMMISGAFRARLSATKGMEINRGNTLDTDKLFDTYMSKHEFEEFLTRRGSKDPNLIRQLREDMSSQGFVDMLMTVDPTQRSGHQVYTRLKIGEGGKYAPTGQASISAHHFVFRMLERDVDRDVATMIPLRAFGAELDRAGLDEYRKGRIKAALPAALIHHAEMISDKTKNFASDAFTKFVGGVQDFLGTTPEHLRSFLSQKEQAHFGYTITRAIDRWIDVLGIGSQEDIAAMGIDDSARSIVESFRSSINKTDLSLGRELSQHIFQGGVKKGKDSPLLDLAKGLVELRESAVDKKMTEEAISGRTYGLFKDFLSSQKDSNRMFLASRGLLERINPGVSSESLDRMLEDLRRGLISNSETARTAALEMRDKLMDNAARLLGKIYGVGYAVQPHIRNKPLSITSVTQDVMHPETDVMSKIVAPIIDSSDTSPGVINELDNAIAEAEAKKLAAKNKGISSILKEAGGNKNALMFGAAAGAGVLALGSIFSATSGPPLPVPMDTRQPTDYGPNLSNMPRVSMPQTINAGAKSGMRGYKDYNDIVKNNRFPSTTNVHFLDDSGGRGDLMNEMQLQRQLVSEF